MDEAMEVGLQEEIIADLTIEYGNEPTFNADIILVKVKDAIREVKNRRNYQEHLIQMRKLRKTFTITTIP